MSMDCLFFSRTLYRNMKPNGFNKLQFKMLLKLSLFVKYVPPESMKARTFVKVHILGQGIQM